MPKPANPFSSLAEVEPGILFLAIADARPATIALVLSRLPDDLAVQIAGKLESDLRSRVLRCLANQQNYRIEIAESVAEAIQDRVCQLAHSGGAACAADIMLRCEPSVESSVLHSLDQQDPQLSAQIRKSLLTFDDIAWLGDHSIQTLLRNIELKTLALALKRCSRAMRRKITRNLSDRAASQLGEEIDYLGFASEREIQRARQRIVAVARHLRQLAASRVA